MNVAGVETAREPASPHREKSGSGEEPETGNEQDFRFVGMSNYTDSPSQRRRRHRLQFHSHSTVMDATNGQHSLAKESDDLEHQPFLQAGGADNTSHGT